MTDGDPGMGYGVDTLQGVTRALPGLTKGAHPVRERS